MKLAEALQERADLNRTIQQLKERLDNNVLDPVLILSPIPPMEATRSTIRYTPEKKENSKPGKQRSRSIR